jgi:cytochrome c oxidase subunit 2
MNPFKKWPIAPEQASEWSIKHDALFWAISALTVVFTILVGVLILWFAIKYRRGSTADRRGAFDHHNGLEALWSIIPLALAIGIFVWSTLLFIDARKMPKEAMEVFVVGKQWMWHLQHMNGIRENNELHLPVNTPIKLTMISQDVIHAMYLPDFRAQFHVVPGRYTELHFTPIKTGRFKMLCAMHCGTSHSEMVGFVYVLSKRDFAAWLENGGNRYKPRPITLAERGKQVWESKGCGGCHGVKDTVRGPSLVGIYNAQRPMADGSTVKADADYLRWSIVQPYRLITKGYEPTMPVYQGQMSEEDVLGLIEYIKGSSNQSAPGVRAPVAPTVRVPADWPPSAPRNATQTANEELSSGATQAQQVPTKE